MKVFIPAAVSDSVIVSQIHVVIRKVPDYVGFIAIVYYRVVTVTTNYSHLLRDFV